MYDAIYRESRKRITELVRFLADEQLDQQVLACPKWTVSDLVAHLAGASHDVANRHMDDAPGEKWTARQVVQRRDRPVADNLAEAEKFSPVMEQILTGDKPQVFVAHDIVSHEADLRSVLGAGRPPEDAWRPLLDHVASTHRPRLPGTVVLRTDEKSWQLGDGEPVITAEVDAYELWRAFFGRRSPAQMRTWQWDGDPKPFITALPVFPARADDLVEA